MTRMPPDQRVSGEEAGGEPALVVAADGLGAATVAGWSDAERHLVARARLAETSRLAGGSAGWAGRLAEGARLPGPGFDADAARAEIRRGGDPLGEAFCALRGPARRRPLGQTFTPPTIIESMIAWAAGTGTRPARVVDPGTGSARFLIAAGRRWPGAELVGVEIDPLAAIVGRASLAAAGLAARSRIILGDYRAVTLPPMCRANAVPGQPALRPPSPDRAGLEGLAAPRRGPVRPARQWAGWAARPLLPGHRPARPARGSGRADHRGRVAGCELRPPGS